MLHSFVGFPKGTYGYGSHPKDEPSGSRGHPRSHGTAMRDHCQGRAACVSSGVELAVGERIDSERLFYFETGRSDIGFKILHGFMENNSDMYIYIYNLVGGLEHVISFSIYWE